MLYENYTVKELKKLCKERGIRGYSNLRKAELIDILRKSTIKKPSRKVSRKKICPSGKIMNPATGRCVKETGAIGLKILQQTKKKISGKKISGKKIIIPFKTKIANVKTERIYHHPGANWWELTSMLYISSKHRDKVCTAITRERGNIPILDRLEHLFEFFGYSFNRHGPVWVDYSKMKKGPLAGLNKNILKFLGLYKSPKNELYVSSNWKKKFKECLQSGKRFIIIPLTLYLVDSESHANMLIYDQNTKELERFEPHGSHFVGTDRFNNPDISKHIVKLIQELLGHKIKYIDRDFCPRFQRYEEIKFPGGPHGYCNAWSQWYADIRLSNPDISREKVTKYAVQELKKNFDKFKRYIHKYVRFIEKIGEQILFAVDRDDVIKRLIDEYS